MKPHLGKIHISVGMIGAPPLPILKALRKKHGGEIGYGQTVQYPGWHLFNTAPEAQKDYWPTVYRLNSWLRPRK